MRVGLLALLLLAVPGCSGEVREDRHGTAGGYDGFHG
jgi:hypothetical protein